MMGINEKDDFYQVGMAKKELFWPIFIKIRLQ